MKEIDTSKKLITIARPLNEFSSATLEYIKRTQEVCDRVPLVPRNELLRIAHEGYWEATRKKKYTVEALIVKPGTKVYNYLEHVHYVTTETRCVVLSGLVGEMWVTTIDKMIQQYTFKGSNMSRNFLAGLPAWPDVKAKALTIVSKNTGNYVEALFIPKHNVFKVQNEYGDTLLVNRPCCEHGAGDYLICEYDFVSGLERRLNCWVVNGYIFHKTYNLRGILYKDRNNVCGMGAKEFRRKCLGEYA